MIRSNFDHLYSLSVALSPNLVAANNSKYLTVSVGQGSGGGSAGWLWLRASHDDVVQMQRGLQRSGTAGSSSRMVIHTAGRLVLGVGHPREAAGAPSQHGSWPSPKHGLQERSGQKPWGPGFGTHTTRSFPQYPDGQTGQPSLTCAWLHKGADTRKWVPQGPFRWLAVKW